MAKKLDDCEFWLPLQFLTDDDLLMDFKVKNEGGKYFGRDYGSGFNPFRPHSDLSSPIESVIGSVDTESDEEELTHKMTDSTLVDSCFGYANTKGWSLSGWPQSTLCGCKQGSSRGSSSGQNLGSLNLNQPSLSYQQLQVAKFERLKQHQIMKQGQGVFGSGKGGFGQFPMGHNRAQNGVAMPMNSSISGSGMRAVFLGSQVNKRECAGTGVFLPRRIGTQTETKKNPGCSTVLLPDRVVQALNLNLEAMDAVQARCYNVGSGLTPASGLKYPNNMAATTQQRRNVRTENTYSQPGSMSQEFRLPHDWTY